MGKTKKDTNTGVAGRSKEIKENAAEQLCMDNTSTGLSANLVPRVSHLTAWGERGETLVGSGNVPL